MRIVPVPTREEGNDCYPLPPDYFRGNYTAEDRRQMRVNGCRQWLLHNSTASDSHESRVAARARKAEAFAACLNFFDQYYLVPSSDDATGEIVFDSGFYDAPPCPTPAHHHTLSRARMLHRKVGQVGPRGSAKTVYWRKSIAFQLISRPAYSFLYITATHDLAEIMGAAVRRVCYDNQRVNDDWAPEYGGDLKPNRGQDRQGVSGFALGNHSWVNLTSAESRKRGNRPIEIVIDDPEWDPRQATATEALREGFDYLLRRVCLPMIMRPGTKICWTGTFISQQSFLWEMMQTKELILPDGRSVEAALVDIYNGWHRIIQPAAVEVASPDPTTNEPVSRRVSCWPEMWPVDDAEKERLGLPADTMTLEQIEEEIGTAAFMAEMQCAPDKGSNAYFPPLTEIRHGYFITGHDASFVKSPHSSNAVISWYRTELGKPVLASKSLREFCLQSPHFICCDTSSTSTKFSDYKVAMCMAITPENELVVLDLWAAQCDEGDLVAAALQMAARWRASTIFPETIRQGASLNQSLQQIVATRAMNVVGVDWLPTIVPLTGRHLRQLSKCAKISSMRWRFVYDKIKLPFASRGFKDTAWPLLFNQISGFQNRGGDDTGLRKDDCVDTLAMHQFVLKGLPASESAPVEEPTDPLELLKQGHTRSPDGLLLAECLNPLELSLEDRRAIMAARDRPPQRTTVA